MMIIAYIKEDNRRDDDNLADQITSNLPTTSAVITSTASPTLLSSNPMAASLEYAAEPVQNPPDIIMQCQQLSMPEKSVLSDFIECFSIQKNMSFLFSVRKTSNAVPIIDALKYIKLHLRPITILLSDFTNAMHLLLNLLHLQINRSIFDIDFPC